MATTVGTQPTWDLFRNSGEERVRVSRRTEAIMTVLSLWFVLGLFPDAYAHSNFPQLESFFTPWHAVFYSGFAVTGGWVLWTIWPQVAQGRRGLAAVPMGYGMTVVALPLFVVFGAADLTWHTLLGIETTTDIFFSPSHLGLITTMIIIVTTPLRAAWSNAALPARPSLGALLPAVLTLALSTSLVLLFLTYGNALLLSPGGIVESYSSLDDGGAGGLATRIVVTNVVLLAPLLLLARRWHLPAGTATLVYVLAALISFILGRFRHLDTALAIIAAGVCVDLLARWLRPTGERRNAFWGFAAAAGLVTWAVYFAVVFSVVGHVPTVAALWTGTPVVAGLIGWLLAALMLPNAASERAATLSD
jgi:hypothetical protein